MRLESSAALDTSDAEACRRNRRRELSPQPDGVGSRLRTKSRRSRPTRSKPTALLPRITAIRLEALPDPVPAERRTRPGPLRQFPDQRDRDRGWRIAAGDQVDPGGRRGGRHERRHVLPEDAAARRDAPRGWRIDASREEKRVARGRSSSRSTPTAGGCRRAAARIRLKHQGAAVGQSLGRFRLSATASADARSVSSRFRRRLRPVLAMAAVDSEPSSSGRISRPSIARLRRFAETDSRSDRRAPEGTAGARYSDRARHARACRLRAALRLRAAPRQLHGQG